MKEILQIKMQTNQQDWWMNGRINIIKKLVKKFTKKDARIIDIGAGTGIISTKLQDSGFNNISVTDDSPNSLKILKEKGFTPIKATLPNINTTEKYDLALLLDVLEHVEDDKTTLNNIYDILCDNSKLIITVPAFMFLWTPKDEDLGHYRRYTMKTLFSVINKTKFKINYISYYNFFLFLPAFVYSVRNKKKTKIKRYNSLLNKVFTPIFSFEKYFINNKVKFPFGVSLICVLEK